MAVGATVVASLAAILAALAASTPAGSYTAQSLPRAIQAGRSRSSYDYEITHVTEEKANVSAECDVKWETLEEVKKARAASVVNRREVTIEGFY